MDNPGKKNFKNVIEIDELEFGWNHSTAPFLRISQLYIANGRRVLLEGPSGCGKSTLLGIIGGVLTPQGGGIHVLGQNLKKLSGPARDHFRADHIGFVFQLFNLVPYLSILENVCLPCHFSKRRRIRAEQRSGTVNKEALRLLAELKLTSQELLRKPVHELSVGQQQRVASARALMGAPEILIADEPTSALDAGLRQSFVDMLIEECAHQSTSLLFVSHDHSLAYHFDEVIQLQTINEVTA